MSGRTVPETANRQDWPRLVSQAIGGKQDKDATLTALAAYNTNGLLTQTAADTFTGRTIIGPAAGLAVSNGSGVAGNPTLALANDLAALEALSGTNTIYYRSGVDTWSAVTIGGGLTFSGGTLSAGGSGGTVTSVSVITANGVSGSVANPTTTPAITLALGAITPSSLASSGALTSSSPSAGIGYATGAGGTVTQATSKSTAVTINTASGQITLNNAALADATTVSFTVNNSMVAATDVPVLAVASGAVTPGGYQVFVGSVAAGSFRVALRNVSGGSLSEAIVVSFVVIKAVTA